ncbi:hypothetical protein ACFWQ6_36770 [Streptomyces coelicoflavus]|uniref:hypothetical protein n=1 Tax=Streptomyces coelicoflavus TaxID=285562 RepID=UPI0036685DBD
MSSTDEREAHERRLRELLAGAVPTPAVPPDRMRRIHGRVLRRRRRRALAATAAAGAVVALLYGSLVVQPSRTQPASPSTERHRVDLAGGTLGLDLPDGWYATEPADPAAPAGVFVANRPLKASESCHTAPTGDFPCSPRAALSDGEALIFLRHPARGVWDTIDGTDVEASPRPAPGESCRSLGGDQEWAGPAAWLAAERLFALEAEACLRNASAATLADVRAILATSAYYGTTAPPASGGSGGGLRDDAK